MLGNTATYNIEVGFNIQNMAANNILMLKKREEMRAGKALEEAFKVQLLNLLQ